MIKAIVARLREIRQFAELNPIEGTELSLVQAKITCGNITTYVDKALTEILKLDENYEMVHDVHYRAQQKVDNFLNTYEKYVNKHLYKTFEEWAMEHSDYKAALVLCKLLGEYNPMELRVT